MTRFGLLAVALVGLCACQTKIKVNPEGYKCDPGDVCPTGYLCYQGVCRTEAEAQRCQGVTCNQTPAPTCKDASTLYTYASSGTCQISDGSCSYARTEVACTQGCQDGACVGDVCATTTCATQPAAECVDANTLRTYAQTGTCQTGTGCVYPHTDVTCQNGCQSGACVNQDLCQNVTCTTPPGPVCASGGVATYSSPGTCVSGTGQCQYPQTVTACAGACQNGMCLSTPKSFAQVLPRIRSAVSAIDVAPGSQGNLALVVGPSGYVAKWDGTSWTQLSSGTQRDLYSVYLASSSAGYVVGAQGTALFFDGSGLSAISLPGSNNEVLVSVHGHGTHVLIAAQNGKAWRSTDGQHFFAAPNPPTTTYLSFLITQAFVDAQDSERMSGYCQKSGPQYGCVLYAPNPAGALTTTGWSTDLPLSSGNTPEISAVGPSWTSGKAFAGQATTIWDHSSSTGLFDVISVPSGLSGAQALGITGGAATTTSFILMAGASSGEPGRLYRSTSSGNEILAYLYGVPSLSRSFSGGVLVADSGQDAVNVLRRGNGSQDALDVAESWVGLTTTPAGSRAYVNAYGDLAVKPQASSIFTFVRSPILTASVKGVVAATGTAYLYGGMGSVYSWTPSGSYQIVGGVSGELRGGCRNSDSELYFVGQGGRIYLWNGANLVPENSNTSQDLNAVVCTGSGTAVAVGASGVVVARSASGWAPSDTVPGGKALTSVWSGTGGLFVAGDGIFAQRVSGGWQALASMSSLTALTGADSAHLYAASGQDVVFFNGASWNSVFSAPYPLSAGLWDGQVVAFAGQAGVVVESQ